MVTVWLMSMGYALDGTTYVPSPTPQIPDLPPYETTAAVLGATVGFGVGHFYAEDPKAGATLLVGEVGSLIGLGTATAWWTADLRRSAAHPRHQLDVAGPVTLGMTAGFAWLALRLFEKVDAPAAARRARWRDRYGPAAP